MIVFKLRPPLLLYYVLRMRVIIGSGCPNAGTVSGAPEPLRYLFIYRVNSSTSTHDMRKHVESHGFSVKSLDCISKPVAKFKSFKLSAPLFDSTLWPQGIRVRKFNVRQQDTDSHNT